MDTIIGLLIDYWMVTAFGVLIIIGWIINLFGVDQEEDIVGFKYKEMPHMMPMRIPTDGRGFWKAIWCWFWEVRHCKLPRIGILKLMVNSMLFLKDFNSMEHQYLSS